MRTWIILGALAIAESIEPGMKIPFPTNAIYVVVVMAGLVMDIVEFGYKRAY